MAIKITTATNGGDSVEFGSGVTAIAAEVTGSEVSSGEGKIELKTTTSGTSTTQLSIDAAGAATFTTPSTSNMAINLQTVTATTSGTSHDYTSIPAGVKRIKVMISGLSSDGTSNMLIQLGDSGGIEATGYLNGAHVITTGTETSTVGFDFSPTLLAAETITGTMTLELLDPATFLWVQTNMMLRDDSSQIFEGVGSKALSAELDRIRLTTTNGTDTFDAGSVNISWEF